MSTLTDRFGISKLLGSMFGGTRNLYDVYGYSTTVSYKDILAKYHRQDITARVIDAPASALWDNPPKITSKVAGFQDAWDDLVRQMDLWQVLSRADKLAGMGEYAVLLMGVDTPGKLASPTIRREGTKLLYLQPYAVDTVTIKELVSDANNARFMLPELYTITPGNDAVQGASLKVAPSFDVHADRVLHVVENPLTNTVYGTPRGVKIYNLLEDMLKIVGGTAETFWLTANRGMQLDIDKDMSLTAEDEANLTEEMEEYYNQLRRTIRTRGVNIKTLDGSVPNPKQVFEMLISLISGTTGIPKRILIGSEAGQLASEQDRSNWAERIEERRSSFGTPTITQQILLLGKLGVLPEVTADQIIVNWPDAFKLSPLERSETSANFAKSANNLSKVMEADTSLVSRDEARKALGLNPSHDPNQESSEEIV